MSSVLEVERVGDVLVLTMNRPDRLNSLDPSLTRALVEELEAAASGDHGAVVLTGAGRGFCAGADLQAGTAPAGERPRPLRHTFNPLLLALTSLPVPLIAAVNGPAAGAGLGLALGADIRIASDAAVFAPAFARIGLVPDTGVSWTLPRIIGEARALEWLGTADKIDAATALEWGLVSRVVPAAQLSESAVALAARLAAAPGRAVPLTKEALLRARDNSLAEQLEVEMRLQAQAVRAPGRQEARDKVAAEISSKGDRP